MVSRGETLIGGGVIAIAVATLAAVCLANVGSNPAAHYPASWKHISTWQGGWPGDQTTMARIGQAQDGTPVEGVIVNVEQDDVTAHHVDVLNRAVLNIQAGGFLQMHNITCTEGATVNISGQFVHDQWLLKDGGHWNLLPGAHQRQQSGGARIGQHEGEMVFWTISGGVYENTFSGFLIGEMESSAIINQSAGLVKLKPDLQFCNSESNANKWYIWGGQLVVTGQAEDPRDYVQMQNHGAPGGIVLSAEGEVYVRGDRTGDLTLVDSDGDELLSGAQFAEFGDWILTDGTAISGYTRFTATEPE